jgi:uncharacterized protein YjbI with pentapeptide repeats
MPSVNNESATLRVNDKPPTDIQAALTVIGRPSGGEGHANLSGAVIAGADLNRANLSGADLSRADLTGAYVDGQKELDEACGSGNVAYGANPEAVPVAAMRKIVAYPGGPRASNSTGRSITSL